MEIISQLSGIVVPVFICVAFGVLWAKVGTPFDTGLITSLVYNIGVPCLIVATFQKVTLDPDAMAEIALASLACYVSFTLLAYLLIRALRLETASYLPALMFPLTGSMGLPVSYFAFGDPGLALAIVYFAIGTIGPLRSVRRLRRENFRCVGFSGSRCFMPSRSPWRCS